MTSEEKLIKIRREIVEELSRAYMYRDYANGLGKALEIIDNNMKELKVRTNS